VLSKYDLGLRCEGGYARVYAGPDRVAVLVAETEGKGRQTSIELDAFRYNINQASAQCQFVGFSGEQRPQSARCSRTGQLRVEINLEAWQIGALVFARGQAA
jgi:hypothetical protein